MEISKANTGNRNVDALAWYAQEFQRAGMDNESSGVATLRHMFVLLFGLGMRESSGKYCEGRDRSRQQHDSRISGGRLVSNKLQRDESASSATADLRAISGKSVGLCGRLQGRRSMHSFGPENFGSGRGREFQRLSKECPAVATEFAALGLRVIRARWGPIARREAEIRPECNTMLLEVQHAVDTLDLCPELIDIDHFGMTIAGF